MVKQLSYRFLFIGIVLLIVANSIFDQVHLYYLVWWLDIPMHMLSGFFVGLVWLALVFRLGLFREQYFTSHFFVVGNACLSALFVGLLWEIFSYIFGHIPPVYGGFAFDTMKDLVNDGIGGIVSALLFLQKGYNKRR